MDAATFDLPGVETWYLQWVRPFLESLEPGRISEFDVDLQRLKKAHAALDAELTACFLGSSGVGKSTLINALVAGDKQLLPSGGIGPLTAQALTIRFGKNPGFKATYHPAKQLNQLAFALQQTLRAGQTKNESTGDVQPTPTLRTSAREPQESEDVDESQLRSEQYLRQGRLLITGHQEGEATSEYVIDGLRAALDQELLHRSQLAPEDQSRIAELRRRLSRNNDGQRLRYRKSAGSDGFRKALEDHATGFLAPMIEQLEVEWDAALLSNGVALVDLPGLGIDGDVYREVTRHWVTEMAKVVVLVVDNRGITEANAQLLRTSGFLNRLLHSAYDPSSDPATLLVAITRIDDIADTRRQEDQVKLKRQHFADVQEESRKLIESQIYRQLEKAWSLDGDAPSDGKLRVINHIIERLRIYPVSAIQYRKCLAEDDDDPAFIKAPKESGVVEMIQGLRQLAEEHRDERQARLIETGELLASRIYATLESIQSRWTSDAAVSEDAERLRQELMSFLQPLREEFRVRQGGFREFLKENLPQRIESLIAEAKHTSGKTIRAYLKRLRDAHWKTLQAAVRRGGTFHGSRHIELPRDFALTFEEPIAEVWGETVLKQIRQRTSQFADDCVALVDQLAKWATDQGTRVKPQLVESQRDAIRSDAARLKTVGREMVNELKQQVTSRLIQAIEPPIRRKCQDFVRKNKDVGTGVRNRILELFEELADDSLEAAIPPAKAILLDCYRGVESEIREVFDQHQDPLQSAAESIVESHESRRRRSDAQKRTAISQSLESIFAASPRPITIPHSGTRVEAS